MIKAATLSACGTYRYYLERSWASGKKINFIMLNPSTADAEVDDPTIRKCVGFAERWGAPGIVVTNLFALRATNPEQLYSHPNPVGPENDAYLLSEAVLAEKVVIAWGTHGMLRCRAAAVLLSLFSAGLKPVAFQLNADGSPRHPLYIPNACLAVTQVKPR